MSYCPPVRADQPSGSRVPPPPDAAFEVVFAKAAEIGGWLTRDQAFSLWSEARSVEAGRRIVEIGSHQGRSTVVLATAAPRVTVVAIDPFVGGAMFGGLATRDKFLANLDRAGVRQQIDLREAKSTELRPQWDQDIALLYIDGKHDYWTLSDDLKWTEFLPDGGRLLIHHAYSSIVVTLGLLRHVLPSR